MVVVGGVVRLQGKGRKMLLVGRQRASDRIKQILNAGLRVAAHETVGGVENSRSLADTYTLSPHVVARRHSIQPHLPARSPLCVLVCNPKCGVWYAAVSFSWCEYRQRACLLGYRHTKSALISVLFTY